MTHLLSKTVYKGTMPSVFAPADPQCLPQKIAFYYFPSEK